MNKFLITLCVLFVSIGAKAHQPDLSSTILVEQGENQWILQIRASLTAFEYEVEKHFGESSYASPEEFQALVIKHVQENTSILFNGTNAAVLQNGQVKLGHETSVSFEVKSTPEDFQSLAVKNSSFSDISRNQGALIVLKEGFAKDQFILNNSNEHTAKLEVRDAKFELITPTQEKAQFPFLILAGALLVLSLIYFAFKKRKTFRLQRA
ncbi:DUF6702 family protein [Lewinella cohaerens]|uniref:DUF6702 family protein n=1 Tax=Lewinella cohaerens TaxID=70995 RepID=UPI00035DC658|nr:DUF6702 family protein [Lewinella cohaerens]